MFLVQATSTESKGFAGLWKGFCADLNEEDTWMDLVEWHRAVRLQHREEGYERWDKELAAHKLAPVERISG